MKSPKVMSETQVSFVNEVPGSGAELVVDYVFPNNKIAVDKQMMQYVHKLLARLFF
jgi:hypothetical protein